MPYSNNKEKIIFTILTCAAMIFIMSFYNIVLAVGFSFETFSLAIQSFLPFFIVGLLLDFFVIGKVAHFFHQKIVSEKTSMLVSILVLQLFMITFMCICMSAFSLFYHHLAINLLFITIVRNFFFALLLQIFVVGPIIRLLCNKVIYPSLA